MGLSPSAITLTAQSLATTRSTATLGSIAGGSTLSVDIYVWYEGNDTYCTTANAVIVEALKIQVEFTGA